MKNNPEKQTILIVDDAPDNIDLLNLILRDCLKTLIAGQAS